jgi:hypothetical protein
VPTCSDMTGLRAKGEQELKHIWPMATDGAKSSQRSVGKMCPHGRWRAPLNADERPTSSKLRGTTQIYKFVLAMQRCHYIRCPHIQSRGISNARCYSCSPHFRPIGRASLHHCRRFHEGMPACNCVLRWTIFLFASIVDGLIVGFVASLPAAALFAVSDSNLGVTGIRIRVGTSINQRK